MSVLHIQGLCLAVQRKDALTVYLLNSAPRSLPVPYHLPSLFISRKSTIFPSVPPLASINARWNRFCTDESFIGWDLHSRTLVLNAGAGAPQVPVTTFPETAVHPIVPADPREQIDWSDIRWVLNSSRLLPGATVRPSFTHLGANVNAIVHIRGGVLRGGTPFNQAGARWVWTLTPTYRTAYTDTLDVVFDAEDNRFELFDVAGQQQGTVPFLPSGEAWLVNEMTDGDAQAYLAAQKKLEACGDPAASGADANDLAMYLEAFTGDQTVLPGLLAAVKPRRDAHPFSNDLNAYDVPSCGTLLVIE
jgi:hypothetical protein